MLWNDDSGDKGDAIVVQYLDGLYSYAVVLTCDHAEADDLVLETYLRAIPAVQSQRADANVKTWLFTILRNIWHNRVIRLHNPPDRNQIDVDEAGADRIVERCRDPHAVYGNKMEMEQVRAVIQELPVTFREIILLREYEELSFTEIAAVLNCPVGTVISRLATARTMLRALLSAKPKGPHPTGNAGEE